MSQPRKPSRRRSNRAKPVDLWRPVPPLGPPERIAPPADPTALVLSLGEPPLAGHGPVAAAYLVQIVDRASQLALALAASADLLELGEPEAEGTSS